MQIIRDRISFEQLREIAESGFGSFVKAAVDVNTGVMAIDAEVHSDQEACLPANGNSKQENLRGINLYPDMAVEDWIEFDSVINLRPANGNLSRGSR